MLASVRQVEARQAAAKGDLLAIDEHIALQKNAIAALLGILAGVMRFVPYVGVAVGALFAAVVALAVDPGWFLALSGLGVFILLDIVWDSWWNHTSMVTPPGCRRSR